MATSGVDRYLKIWDLRTYKQLQCYRIASGASNLAFSQRECIAAGIGNVVEVKIWVLVVSSISQL